MLKLDPVSATMNKVGGQAQGTDDVDPEPLESGELSSEEVGIITAVEEVANIQTGGPPSTNPVHVETYEIIELEKRIHKLEKLMSLMKNKLRN